MKAQELDPFAIKSYTFALGKTNNFFSCTTVILSLCVIGLSFGISYDTLSHLWLPLKDLPRTITNIQQFPGPLTSALVCYNLTDPSLNGTIPAYRVWNSNMQFLQIPYVSQAQALKKYPTLKSTIGGNFGCVNIAGFAFTNDISAIYLQVQVKQAYYYVETASINSIANQVPNTFLKSGMVTTPGIISSKFYYYRSTFQVTGIKTNIYNSLYVNDEGKHEKYFQTENTVGNVTNFYTPTNSSILTNNSVLALCSLRFNPTDSFSSKTLTIIRYDVGFIIGAVLSWISIFGLICGFIVGPIMDKSLNLIQAETLFYTPLQDRKPSVLKLMVASFKQGIFPKEDKYLKLIDELQKLKDVSCSLKVQKTLRRLCPRNSKLYKNQVIAAQHSFDEPQSDDFGVQTFSEGGKFSAAEFKTEEDPKKDNLLTKARKGILCWLDSGSDDVSINYSGKGHGSKQSVCVSLVFLIGFLAFLVIFGVLKYSKQDAFYTQKGSDDLNYSFVAKEIIATTLNGSVKFSIVDGYNNVISNLSIATGTDCLTYANSSMQRMIRTYTEIRTTLTVVTKFFCSVQDYDLVYSSDPSKVRSLLISTTQSYVYIFHMQTDPTSDIIDKRISFLGSIGCTGVKYYTSAITIYNILEDGENIFTGTQLQKNYQRIDFTRKRCGYYIELNPNQIYKETTNTDFFTLIQNIWGLTTIAVTVLLVKLTKYINFRQKQKAITPEKSEFRDNLCIFLSKINGIMAGRHKGQLEKAKYYLKQPLQKLRN